MATRPHPHANLLWRKASASAGVGECVEVATSDRSVLARDSRDQLGAVLEFTSAQWLDLLARIKNVDKRLG